MAYTVTETLSLICQGNNKRPSKTDGMRKQAATELVAAMVKSGTLPDLDLEDCADDIVKATRWSVGDGYEIARELENRYHWDCNMRMVEELDEFSSILDRIYDAAEDLWAAENPHPPQFVDGDTVTWKGHLATIHGVYEYRPQRYKVRQGKMSGGETSYYVVPFEDVSVVSQPEIK